MAQQNTVNPIGVTTRGMSRASACHQTEPTEEPEIPIVLPEPEESFTDPADTTYPPPMPGSLRAPEQPTLKQPQPTQPLPSLSHFEASSLPHVSSSRQRTRADQTQPLPPNIGDDSIGKVKQMTRILTDLEVESTQQGTSGGGLSVPAVGTIPTSSLVNIGPVAGALKNGLIAFQKQTSEQVEKAIIATNECNRLIQAQNQHINEMETAASGAQQNSYIAATITQKLEKAFQSFEISMIQLAESINTLSQDINKQSKNIVTIREAQKTLRDQIMTVEDRAERSYYEERERRTPERAQPQTPFAAKSFV